MLMRVSPAARVFHGLEVTLDDGGFNSVQGTRVSENDRHY